MDEITNHKCSITKHSVKTLKDRLDQIDKALKELRGYHGAWALPLIRSLVEERERICS